jgi:adenylate kinase
MTALAETSPIFIKSKNNLRGNSVYSLKSFTDMLNLILFGPPGCGKGTQSARVACKYKLEHLSTGDLLREEVRKGTSEGSEMKRYISKGLLVPDNMVLKKLYQLNLQYRKVPGFILDGFPRTLNQAEILDRFLEKKGFPVCIVIFMVVDEDELIQRIIGRSEDSGRIDDNEKTIMRRLEVYRKHTLPLKDYYLKQNKLTMISGMAPVKEVAARINSVIDQYLVNRSVLLTDP